MQEKVIRTKELTQEQLETLRNFPQFLQINQSQFVLYNLVQKESNSGLFKNQRLLILDIINESICYLSKIPPGLIPFQKYEQVKSQQPKEWILQKEIYEDNLNKFTCQKLVDKNGIEIKLNKKDKKLQWIYYFANKDVMNQWYSHIGFLFLKTRQQIDAHYHSASQQNNNEPSKVIKAEENQQGSIKNELNNSKASEHSKRNGLSAYDLKTPSEKKSENVFQKNNDKGDQEYDARSKRGSDAKSDKNIGKQEINVSINNKSENESEFNEFQQRTPLGDFVRQDFEDDKNSIHSKASQNIQIKQKPEKVQTYTSKKDNLKGSRAASIAEKQQSDNEKQKDNQQDLSALQYQPISISLKPQNRIDIKKIYTSKQKQWSQLYQTSNKKTQVYFEFVSQSINTSRRLIDKLSEQKNHSSLADNNGNKKEIINGIEYTICYRQSNEEDLLYESSEDQPIVYDLYQQVRQIKQKFYRIKRVFSKEPEQSQLAVLIQYKLVTVLCLALEAPKQQSQQSQTTDDMHLQDELFEQMQQAQLNVVSTLDFRTYMRKNNVGSLNWSYLYYKTNNIYLRSIFLAQIFCQISLNILRSELFHIYTNFALDEELPHKADINNILGACALHLVQRLMSQTDKSKQLWKIIKSECQRVYQIEARRDEVNQNYLSFAILQNSGLHNLKQKPKIRNKLLPLITYLSKPNQVEIAFKPIVHCLQYQKMTPTMKDITQIIVRKQYSRHLQLVDLRREVAKSIPQQINYLTFEINLALSATVSYKVQLGFQIFQVVKTQEPSNYNYLIALSKIRQLLYEGCEPEAVELTSNKIQQITFYVGKSPLLTEFYEAFCNHNLKQSEYQKVISNIRRQVEILSQSLGVNCEPMLLKRVQLSDLYFEMNKRDDCIREMTECRKICEASNNTESKVYKNILLQLSKIALNMGKHNDCINNTLIILKKLQTQKDSSNPIQNELKALEFLKVVELLCRAFELSKRKDQQFQVVKLSVQRCKQVHSLKVCNKLFKIALFPFLKKLPLIQGQMLLDMVEKFVQSNIYVHMSQKQLLLLIRSRELMERLEKKISELQGLKLLYEKIVKKRIFQDFNAFIGNIEQIVGKGQFYDFLVDWLLITKLVSAGFIQSLIKDSYYQ